MKNGFLKVAAGTPHIRVADPVHNTEELVRLTLEADALGVRILVFPELSLTGATCGDLFWSDTLQVGARTALETYLNKTSACSLLSVVGLPLVRNGRLYDCAAVCHAGRVLGLVPATVLSSVGGIDLARHFAIDAPEQATLRLFDEPVPFGTALLFTAEEMPTLSFSVALGAALYSAASHGSGAALICRPAAFCETVGLGQTLELMLCADTIKGASAAILSNSGDGESTTDAAFGGRKLIVEMGEVLARSTAFAQEGLCCSEIDLEKLAFERRRKKIPLASGATIPFSLPLCETHLTRPVDAHPFIPDDPLACAARCEEILAIQSAALATRIRCAYAQKIVVGISGGLDSTLALLVMVRAMDALQRPRTDIIAVTMPCFGTTVRTKTNATVLCEELGVDFRCVDIWDAVNGHFRDIGHDPEVRDVTYENAQARERTQVLMDIANECGGMVIGTGDLSELALGWATYNGDHMSMYGVNADLPKTLIRHVVAHCADTYADSAPKIASALRDILDTPVSPELLPAEEDGSIAQKTEDLVGPYELHDFYLYYMLRYGFSPAKLYRLAQYALGETYDDATLKKWLCIFLRRFFSQQFKRSCLPDGPRVGSVGLSPRGGWVMPSDASRELWMAEAECL